VLRRALGQAERWGLVARNWARLVSPPRVARHEVRPYSPAEVRALLEAVPGNRLEALFVLTVATGLRVGEVLGLAWADVDLERGALSVRRCLQRVEGRLQLLERKSERSRRTIALPRVAAESLWEHRRRQLEERLAAGPLWEDSGLVFTTPTGGPIESRSVARRWRALCHRHGLRPLRFHDLRHTAASLLLAQGVQLRAVMDVLGHSCISVTMDTYAHVMPELLREAADRMDALLRRGD